MVAALISQLAMTYSGWGIRRDRKRSSWPMVLFLLLSLGAGLEEELEVNFLIRDNICGSPGDYINHQRIVMLKSSLPSKVSTATAARSSLGTKVE